MYEYIYTHKKIYGLNYVQTYMVFITFIALTNFLRLFAYAICN